MDLKSYYDDLRKIEAELIRDFPKGVVYVTSLFHRERNSTAGSTLSATHRNAARVITDGTHRLATKEEIAAFHKLQQDELRKNTAAEQKNKKQYIVVVDQKEQINTEAGEELAGSGTSLGHGKATATK